MLGSSSIGSQAIAEPSSAQTQEQTTAVVAASGRSSGTSTVFAVGIAIVSADGRSAGKSTVGAVGGIASKSVTAADKLTVTLLEQPYAVAFIQTEPMYGIQLL